MYKHKRQYIAKGILNGKNIARDVADLKLYSNP